MAATRVTVVGPGWEARVTLPAGIPLVLTLPSVLEQLPVRWADDRPVEWRFSRAEGGPIDLSGTPETNGIRSGAVLRLTGRPAEETALDGGPPPARSRAVATRAPAAPEPAGPPRPAPPAWGHPGFEPTTRQPAIGAGAAIDVAAEDTVGPGPLPPSSRSVRRRHAPVAPPGRRYRRIAVIGLAAGALVAGAVVAIGRGGSDGRAAAGPQAAATAAATTVQLTSPAPGAVVAGSAVTVTASLTTGTGGPVEGVTLLIDGVPTGDALAAAPYTFTWNTIATPDGDHAVGVVATRDNIEIQPDPVTVTVANGRRPAPATGALSLRADSAVPEVSDQPGDGPGEVGLRFSADQPGAVAGVRFYQGSAGGTPVVGLWTAGGALLATADAPSDPTPGWNEALFAEPVATDAGTTYVVSYFSPRGFASYTSAGRAEPVDNGPLHSPAGGGTVMATTAPAFPTGSGGATDYAVDVLFIPA